MTIPIKPQQQPQDCTKRTPAPFTYLGDTPISASFLKAFIKVSAGWLKHKPRTSQQIIEVIFPNLSKQKAWCVDALPVVEEHLLDCGYTPEPHPTDAHQWLWVVRQPPKSVEAEWDEVFLEEWT